MKEIYLGTAHSWGEMCEITQNAILEYFISDEAGIAFNRCDDGETSSVEIYLRIYESGFKEFYFIP